ncbi:MAG: ribosome biogenesis factor YjgA [Candidatus Competibacteraceae bacterium]
MARRRQLQYIGKLMRGLDVEPIQMALETLTTAKEKIKHHQLEQLCEALLADEEVSLNEFLTDYPDTDRQHLRQLIRNAVRERTHQQPPRSKRALLRYLREVVTTG